MDFALVGQSDESLQLVDLIANHSDHRIVAQFPLIAAVDQPWTQSTLNPEHDSWESLLHSTVAEAAIISPSDNLELQADCMRKLAQAAVPLWVIHPIGESILGYEIEMICQDSHGLVVPYIPAAHHPAVEQLIHFSKTRMETIERVNFDRSLQQRNRHAVLRQLSIDVQLIRMLVGEIQQVAAMNSSQDDSSYRNLSVQMRSSPGTIVNWSVKPTSESSVATLQMVTPNETICLNMSDSVEKWAIESSSGKHQWSSSTPINLAQSALDCFVNTVSGTQSPLLWTDACRNLEVAEIVPESIRRRRTIDLLHEEHSEQATFMGMMAIGGCGLLVFSSLFLVFAGIVEGLRLPFREHILWKMWPIYLLVPLAVFLVLQLLKFVFSTSEPAAERNSLQNSDKFGKL